MGVFGSVEIRGNEKVVAWAMRMSGGKHRGQKAQAMQRPRGQALPSEPGGQQGDPGGWNGGIREGSTGYGRYLFKG